MNENDLQHLTAEERELLLCVLQKKFVLKEGVLTRQCKKPKSENIWKFVVKKSIKFLKRRVKFDNKMLIKGEKLEDEKQFFDFYFSKTAQSLHIPIESFYLPNSILRKT